MRLSPTAALAAIAVAVLLAGCGGRTPSESAANYVELEAVEGVEVVDGLTVSSAASDQAGSVELATPDYSYVEELLQNFLDARASVIADDAGRTALEPYAQGAAIGKVLAEQQQNGDKVDQEYVSAIAQLATWPNIASIEPTGESFIVRDCTEHQEVNAAGQFHVWFVDRSYTLVAANGQTIDDLNADLVVSDFETLHNGFLEPEQRFGCVPQSFAERAEAVAATALAELVTAARNPDTAELTTTFEDQFRASLEASIATQAEEQLALATAESAAFSSVGIDTHVSLLRFDTETSSIVVVESCRRFPEGVTFVDATNGAETQLAAPGTESVQWIHVQIPTWYASESPDQVVLIEDHPELTCGERP